MKTTNSHNEGKLASSHSLDNALNSWVDAYRLVLKNSEQIIKGEIPAGKLIDRGLVAAVSQSIGEASFYQVILAEMVNSKAHSLLSLACGTGEMAIDFLKSGESNTAVGVDRSPEACDLARHAAREAGVGDRLLIYQQDIADIVHHETTIINGLDLIECSFSIHDYLAEHGLDTTLELLRGISRLMNQSGIFFVCEATHATPNSHWFSKIFNLIHNIQGIDIPTDQGWKQIFRSAGLNIRKTADAGMPGSKMYVLSRRQSEPISPYMPVFKQVPGHRQDVPFYIHPDVTNTQFSIAALDLGKLPEDGPVKSHQHPTDEFYILPDYPEEVSIKVTIDGHSPLFVKSPAVLRIPAGTMHRFQVINARLGQFIFGCFPHEGV